MPDLLAAADLVICRAGANTLAELAALGKAAVLIPLPLSASRGEQIRNARHFASGGGAVCLVQEETTSDRLLETVRDLLNNEPRRRTMSASMRRMGDPGAARRISDLIRERAGL
jgi:UDP-N-acetylglucosamine--N-acetylmuramyl-(pentapeptide) pyrophosphoryl-undecaprenol N-acetylglucosamine transferase